NYLNFRFFLEDDFNTDSQYSIGASFNFTDINSHGAELATNVNIGTDKLAEVELYSPVMSGQKTFYTASLRFTDDNRNVPVSGFDDTSLAASRNYLPVTYKTWRAELALGYQETLWREFKIGGRYSDGSANYSTLPDYADMNFTRQGIFFNYRI
ncbi:serine protease, partial [Vibrio alginolyticus]|nr:serine protease [Vibrio alginolyticus]